MTKLVSYLLAGTVASLVMLVAMTVARFTLGTPLLPELIAQQSFALISPPLFTAVIRLLGFAAKWVVFVLAVGGYWAGGMGLGWLYGILLQHLRRIPGIGNGCLFGLAVWLALMMLGMPLLGLGVFGVGLRQGPIVSGLVLLALHLLYGALLGGLASRPACQLASPAATPVRTRRAVLRGLATWPLVWTSAVVSSVLLRTWGRGSAGTVQIAFEAIQGLSPEITSNHQFYTVSKNFFDPAPNPKAWQLKIHGLVERPLALSLEQLKVLPAHEDAATFICISNEIGGDLISTAIWRGVRLKDLLEMAGLQPAGHRIVLRADDGYSTGVPVERCLQPQTLLAYEMNGAALPHSHGFPLRVVIPGYYGMKQPKWLTEIEVVAHDYQGYWEQRGWADEALVKTMSRIDVPAHRGQLPFPAALIAGIAFAGDRGIKTVAVSVDGGSTWQEMRLKPPRSPYSWTLWAGAVTFPEEGDYLLTVRAVDGWEVLQEARVTEPLPDGASGYHKMRVRVRKQ
jgi:DMSO/TMAO reductase YedYZ molybdopterin-dependent catalytic subunit